MIRFGPKVAPPPEGLDDDSQERLDYFLSLAKEGELIPTRRLVWLAVMAAKPLDLKDRGGFKKSGETIRLRPHTMVLTPQQAIGAQKVNYYLTELQDGKSLKPLKLTDIGPQGLWHLDGLHRLLAARILGMTVDAKIYR
ncbi:MAG TPA: hypothetical protein VM093_07120 [Aeromicrobium sp.]|nr:hypothetical protein [Aeromicrobium sp.]